MFTLSQFKSLSG